LDFDTWFTPVALEMSNVGIEDLDISSVLVELLPEASIYSPAESQCLSSPQEDKELNSPELWPAPLDIQESLLDMPLPITASPTELSSDTASQTSEASKQLAPRLLSRTVSAYVCPVKGCSKRFLQRQQLSSHALMHQRAYACDYCPAQYPHAKSLREHRQTKHLNIRYKCNIEGCNESVAQKKNLRRHKRARHGINSE